MNLLLNFFRKKVTKVYTIIFALIIFIIIMSNVLLDFLIDEKNKIFSDNSFVFVYTDNDIIDNLKFEKGILKIDDCVFADIESELIKNGNEVILDSSGNIISKTEENQSNDISLIDMKISGYEKSIVVEDSNNSYQLGDNEVVFGIIPEIYELKEENIDKIKDKELILNANNIKYKFILKTVVPSKFPIIIVSHNSFLNILYKSYNHLYRLTVNSYDNAYNITKNLAKRNNVIKSSIETSYNEKDSDKADKIDSFLITFNIIEKIILIFSLILLYIIISNEQKDYNKDFLILKRLGFSKRKLKLTFILILIIQFLLSMFFSFSVFYTIYIIINKALSINLNFLTYRYIIEILLMLLLLIIYFGLFKNREYYSH